MPDAWECCGQLLALGLREQANWYDAAGRPDCCLPHAPALVALGPQRAMGGGAERGEK